MPPFEPTIACLWRYPVKGLLGHDLPEATLVANERVPGDRVYAFAESDAPLDVDRPTWVPRRHFAQCARAPGMAAIRLDLDGDVIVLSTAGRDGVRAPADDPDGVLARWLEQALDRKPGSLRFVRAASGGFTDDERPFVSILGAGTMTSLTELAGMAVDPRRFRANVLLDGLAPFEEFELIGRRIVLGDAVIEIVERIERCIATTVEPETGLRTIEIPLLLRRNFGHIDCGVFGRVVRGGRIAPGMATTVVE